MRLLTRLTAAAVGTAVITASAFVADGELRLGRLTPTSTETPAVPLCGVADVASVSQPTTAVPANPVNRGPGGFTASSFAATGTSLHVLDAATRTIRRFSLDGALQSTVQLPFQLAAPNLVVDESGNLYVAQYPATLVKLSPAGQTLWTRAGVATQQIDAVYGIGSGTSFRVGVVGRGEAGSALYDVAGSATGRSSVTGSFFTRTSDGGLVATDGAYVRRYDAAGVLASTFGDRRVANDPAPTGGPFHFYLLGAAALAPDGSYFVADAGRGIEWVDPNGHLEGIIPEETVGYLTERSSMAVVGDRLYYSAGGRFQPNQHLAWISLADARAVATAPGEPRLVLGYGAGVTTGVAGNFFRHGQAPSVVASFDPWWGRLAPGLRLRYTVRDRRQVTTSATVQPVEVALPTTEAGLANIPLTLPPVAPGSYEIDVRLVDAGTGATVSATCITYTVGSPLHRLDLAALPPGADYGGPAPARGVALADQLGFGNFRAPLDWSRLLPDINGPMRFEAFDAPFAAGAAEAARRGVAFHVQLGAGGPIEQALVQNGTWGARVRELVAHFAGVVRAWEVWNEPNITFGTADAYVNRILRPASEAIRGADPTATIIGGSVVGMDLAYYEGIARAGGLSLLDVVAIHPYTGHNRSWEEQGTPASIAGLRDLLNRYGAPKPVWVTEAAWWSDGPGNYLGQADKVARAMLWSRQLGVERWNYFMMEGGYGDYGFTYSLIESGAQPDDFVKPAALAAMTANEMTRGRAPEPPLTTGVPHAYAMRFGPAGASNDTVLAAWTDDLPVRAQLAVSAPSPVQLTIVDLEGRTSSLVVDPARPAPFDLTGSPVYVVAPAGVIASVVPAEQFGTNVAAASNGATATASSATGTNPASAAIDGISHAAERGDLIGLPAWASAPGDTSPGLTVRLAAPATLNRVVVSTHSIGSIVPGLRTYAVRVQGTDGTWTTVGEVRDLFFHRRTIVTFAPRTAVAVRVVATNVDYGGLAGGVRPWFWRSDAVALTNAGEPWYGPAVVYELEAYAGSAAPSTTSTTTSTTTPPPAAPTGLTATATAADAAAVSWSSTSGAVSYELERSTDNVNFTRIAATSSTLHADAGLAASTTYHYRVRAVSAAGASPYSATASVTTPAPPPPPPPPAPESETVTAVPAVPTGLEAQGISASAVSLSWSASTGATSYVVERSTNGTTFAVVAAVTGTGFVDGNLAGRTTYWYRVSARNEAGTSAATAPVSARTKNPGGRPR